MTVKNYKTMCELLGEKVKSGKGKLTQLSEWARYFKWDKEKDKKAFTIQEIFEEPRLISLTDYLEIILLHMLSTRNNQRIRLSKNILYNELNMVNKNFVQHRVKYRKIHEKTNIPIHIVKEFLTSIDNMFERELGTLLSRLESKKLILYELRWMVAEKREIEKDVVVVNEKKPKKKYIKVHRPATTDEKKMYLNLQQTIIAELGHTSMQTVISSGDGKEYYKILSKRLEKQGFYYFYKVYDIVFNTDPVKNAKSTLIKKYKTTLIKKYKIPSQRVKGLKKDINTMSQDVVSDKIQNRLDSSVDKIQNLPQQWSEQGEDYWIVQLGLNATVYDIIAELGEENMKKLVSKSAVNRVQEPKYMEYFAQLIRIFIKSNSHFIQLGEDDKEEEGVEEDF